MNFLISNDSNMFNYFFNGVCFILLVISVIRFINLFRVLSLGKRLKVTIRNIAKGRKMDDFEYIIEFKERSEVVKKKLLHHFHPYLYKIGDAVKVIHFNNKVYLLNSFYGIWSIFSKYLLFSVLLSIVLISELVSGLDIRIAFVLISIYVTVYYLVPRLVGLVGLRRNTFIGEGVLKEIIEDKDDGDRVFYPKIQFEYNGSKYNFISHKAYMNKSDIRSSYRVIFDPNFPDFARVKSFMSLYFEICVLSMIVLIFIVFVVII